MKLSRYKIAFISFLLIFVINNTLADERASYGNCYLALGYIQGKLNIEEFVLDTGYHPRNFEIFERSDKKLYFTLGLINEDLYKSLKREGYTKSNMWCTSGKGYKTRYNLSEDFKLISQNPKKLYINNKQDFWDATNSFEQQQYLDSMMDEWNKGIQEYQNLKKEVETIKWSKEDGEYNPLYKINPLYPRRALERGIMGYTIIELTITETGTVENPVVLEGKCANSGHEEGGILDSDQFSPCSIFNAASKNAALKMLYKPKILDGKPFRVEGVNHKFSFLIEGFSMPLTKKQKVYKKFKTKYDEINAVLNEMDYGFELDPMTTNKCLSLKYPVEGIEWIRQGEEEGANFNNCYILVIYEEDDEWDRVGFYGEYRNHKRNGSGFMMWKDGDTYFGEWKDGFMHGQGIMMWPNGDTIIGKYKDDYIHGQATYTWVNGDKYVGSYKEGMGDGAGTMYYKDGKTEERIYSKGNNLGDGCKRFGFKKGTSYYERCMEILLNENSKD